MKMMAKGERLTCNSSKRYLNVLKQFFMTKSFLVEIEKTVLTRIPLIQSRILIEFILIVIFVVID